MMIRYCVLIVSGLFSFYPTVAQKGNCEGQWVGEIVRRGKNWKTELAIHREGERLRGYFNVPDYGLFELAFENVYQANDSLHCFYSDRNSTARFDGAILGNAITGKWEGLGMKATFSLEKTNSKALQLPRQEVFFLNGKVKLVGTLILPVGAGPFPAIVQTHGSGNQTRSEDFYRSRAYLFARNGIAALIYDHRGKGGSSGSEVSMELLADDAIAGIHFLQNHPLVRKDAVGIMGFSQGGYIGPLAVSRSNDIAFLIAGSAPGVTPDEQNDYDVEMALRRKKVTEEIIASVLTFRKDLRNYQYSGIGDRVELEQRLSQLKTQSWFGKTLLTDALIEPATEGVKQFLTFNPVPVWEKVHVPTLLVWGEMDNVVPVKKSKMLIESALLKSKNKTVSIMVFPNSNHGMARVDDTVEWDWPRLTKGYHELLIEWTKEVTK